MISILHREMRVVSRRPWTFRLRIIVTVLAFFMAAFVVASSSPGAGVFTFLTHISFFFCLLQGIRLAAGSIADEKREGTLGLLFLTDLRPIDIVAGKLFAIFIPMIQPLLAFLPVLAITVLLGGVTGGEVLRAALVLAGILIFSISIGLFVSAAASPDAETGNATVVCLFIATFAPWLVSFGPLRSLRFLSPWTAFQTISDPGYRADAGGFWISLLITLTIAALGLWAAAWFLPRRWEQHKALVSKPEKPRAKPRFSPAEKAKILDRNPGEWLAVRDSMSLTGARLINCAIILLIVVGVWATGGSSRELYFPLGLGVLLLAIRLASQASYPLANARRSGAIEMLISTPLPPRALIDGQKAALFRQFLLPVLLLCVGSCFVFIQHTDPGRPGRFIEDALSLVIFNVAMVISLTMVAVIGMWAGLKEKSPNAAFFKTLFWLLLLPIPFSCLCPIIGPLVWIVVFIIANRALSGFSLRKLLAQENAKFAAPLPPPVIRVADIKPT